VTPEQLAAELGVSAKTLRAWLRGTFPRPAAQKGSNWTLAQQHVDAARAWRAGSRRPSPHTPGSRVPSAGPAAAAQPEIRWDPRLQRSFRRQRFRGFVPLGDAVADRQAFLIKHEHDLLDSAGVYGVFASIDWTPKWKTRGRFSNVITPWPLAQLRERWVEDVELIYIGCAGATASSRKLSKRISDLLKHGAGQISTSGPHKGGERLWQCIGWEDFTLAWKAYGPYPEPHDLEVAIGQRFQHLTGQLPFANVRL
jgi:hypothetical protein